MFVYSYTWSPAGGAVLEDCECVGDIALLEGSVSPGVGLEVL